MMTTQIHELAQHHMEQLRKKSECDELGQAIEEMKTPVSTRIEDRYVYFLDRLANEYLTTRGALVKDLLQCAISDFLDEVGYDFDDLTEEYIEHKKKEAKKNV